MLFAPILSDTTYLIDLEGQVVHMWKGEYAPAASVYFLDNGNLLRTAREPDVEAFTGGGQGGRIRELTWESELAWDFLHSTDEYLTHHDVELLPNGNILAIAWERKTVEEARRAGRRPDLLPEKGLWPDMVLELEPTRPEGARIVWEWHMWDHLVQNHDPEADNYGDPAARPGRIDTNGDGDEPEISQEELEQLQALGYVPADADVEDVRHDLLHTNAVAYNAALDQIALSVPRFNEIWIIDHSTTAAQAAGHTGGNSGRGGDLLYRWGNPQAYGRGTEMDRKFFGQHDAQWIAPELPGAGNILVFNNGSGRSPVNYSSVDEFTPPVDQNGNYPSPGPGTAFGPTDLTWTYFSDPLDDFFSFILSGAQRQPNGNTLICQGNDVVFFEVSPAEATVWEYRNPVGPQGPVMQGGSGGNVSRSPRYSPDYAAFDGRDLTPGDRIEIHNTPLPALDGTAGTTPVTVSTSLPSGGRIELAWDVSSCIAHDYKIIYGRLEDVSTLTLQGSQCSIGNAGTFVWSQVPPEDLFFLLVGVDDTGIYESSWGLDSTGEERRGSIASYQCSATNKDSGPNCP